MRWLFFIVIVLVLIFYFRNWDENPSEQSQITPEDLIEFYSPTRVSETASNRLQGPIQLSDDILAMQENTKLPPALEKQSLALLSQILKQVHLELGQGLFGDPGEMTYNMVYHFMQSLTAYRRYLEHPSEGPPFHIYFDGDFSGQYHFKTTHIRLGSFVLGEGEGRFLATLFHEYQHHLFHSIYGTPALTDIVQKFYNELTGYLFEFLLLSYIPAERFIDGHHRGDNPDTVRELLQDDKPYEIISLIFDRMFVAGRQNQPIYGFLQPTALGLIKKEDIVSAIDADFMPDPDAAEELQIISEQFFGPTEEEEEFEEEEELIEDSTIS